MMRNAGYMQVSRAPAYDDTGKRVKIVEISIDGGRYAIELQALSRAVIYGRRFPVRRLRQNFGKHLGDAAGSISLSFSKKGLVLEMFSGKRYAVSRSSVSSMLNGYTGHSKICEVPEAEHGGQPGRNQTFQSTIRPWVAV